MKKEAIFKQVQDVTTRMIQFGLSNYQQFPSMVRVRDKWAITIKDATTLSSALKDVPYQDIYTEIETAGDYNIKMLDGALIQMLYTFDDNIYSHRLAFFPSPNLDDYDKFPEIYESDEIYADVIAQNTVAFPIRFDFSRDDKLYKDVDHPKSHLTLGQFENCRIPVSAPLTPTHFMQFILRNFYSNAFKKNEKEFAASGGIFSDVISTNEMKIAHLRLC